MTNRPIKNLKKLCLLMTASLLASCQTASNIEITKQETPRIVPAVEIKRSVKHQLGIIGEVEPVYILPIKSSFLSRIDTGAQSSSIDAENIKTFERDGKKWVSFSVTNRETNEKQKFEKRIEEIKSIKRINGNEERLFVVLDIRIGNQTIKEKFSLAQRDKFDYQVLIGRNILTGRAIVDTSLKNTLQ